MIQKKMRRWANGKVVVLAVIVCVVLAILGSTVYAAPQPKGATGSQAVVMLHPFTLQVVMVSSTQPVIRAAGSGVFARASGRLVIRTPRRPPVRSAYRPFL